MIVSASRRTDIPAFFMPWLVGRLREGFALVRNPYNPHRVSRIPLTPDVLDAMVLWTKNPLPMLPHLDALRDVPYYIQFTLTPYGRDIERNLPDKTALLGGFSELSRRIGPERLVWRYDPLLFNAKWTPDVHLAAFARMAERLSGCTDTSTVSILDHYRRMEKACAPLGLHTPAPEVLSELLVRMAEVAAQHGMRLTTCAEDPALLPPGVFPAHFIDPVRLEKLVGVPLSLPRDANQRPACGCARSVDIGCYNTCSNGCLYCYANWSDASIQRQRARYDPDSPLLCGQLTDEDIVTEGAFFSDKLLQTSLFD